MAGAVASVGVCVVVVGTAAAAGLVLGAVLHAQRLADTADAAALAAADTASGAVTGIPCEAAATVAAAAGASVRECVVDGLVATITVAGAYGGVPFDARSRAGPPMS